MLVDKRLVTGSIYLMMSSASESPPYIEAESSTSNIPMAMLVVNPQLGHGTVVPPYRSCSQRPLLPSGASSGSVAAILSTAGFLRHRSRRGVALAAESQLVPKAERPTAPSRIESGQVELPDFWQYAATLEEARWTCKGGAGCDRFDRRVVVVVVVVKTKTKLNVMGYDGMFWGSNLYALGDSSDIRHQLI